MPLIEAIAGRVLAVEERLAAHKDSLIAQGKVDLTAVEEAVRKLEATAKDVVAIASGNAPAQTPPTATVPVTGEPEIVDPAAEIRKNV